MSKKYIEAFNRITLHTEYDNDGSYDALCFDNDCELVDDALYRLESIDNANPDKALELIDSIREYSHSLTMVGYLSINYDLDVIQETIVKAQEQDQVLEIIKKKNVEIYWLKHSKTVEEYNKHIKNLRDTFNLIEEEFNLVKRWLE